MEDTYSYSYKGNGEDARRCRAHTQASMEIESAGGEGIDQDGSVVGGVGWLAAKETRVR